MKILGWALTLSLGANLVAYSDMLPHYNILTDAQLHASNQSATIDALERLKSLADYYAQQHEVDPLLFRALIKQESDWNPAARSKAGASGLTQLMPATAAGECGIEGEDLFDAEKNLSCGARYLSRQLKRFGDVTLALAAYNSGPTRVAKLGRVPRIAETQNYVRKISAHYGQLRGE